MKKNLKEGIVIIFIIIGIVLFSILVFALILHFAKCFFPPYSNNPYRLYSDIWFINICAANILLFPFIFISKKYKGAQIETCIVPCDVETFKYDMKLDTPEIIKQGGRYGIKLKAVAPSIHMIRVDVESTFEPIIGSEVQSKELINYFKKLGARSVEICTMLDKPARRTCNTFPKYIGAEIEDKFIIGFGLDYNEKYRNLPYIDMYTPYIPYSL